MSFLGTEKLRELIKDESQHVITPQPDDATILKRVKDAAYELSLGNEAFRTDSTDKKKEFLKDKEEFRINPGQFALLLTKERVHVPKEYIAFISIKAKIKLRGLINVSGFHVDPGFSGNLVFSVYNAGTTPISIEKGEPCFLIWFSKLELDKSEGINSYNGEHNNQESIPPRYIDALVAGELASPNVLLEKINNNFKTLDGKATMRDYVFKTGLGVLIVLAIKFFGDWRMYENGLKDGYERGKFEVARDSTINALSRNQSQLLLKFDSLTRYFEANEIIDEVVKSNP